MRNLSASITFDFEMGKSVGLNDTEKDKAYQINPKVTVKQKLLRNRNASYINKKVYL